jgi:copper chaperone CopZ
LALSLLLSGLVLIAALSGCQSPPRAQGDSVSPTATGGAEPAGPGMTGESNATVLHVYGMSCPLCATNVDKQLLKIDGVNNVRVNLSSGEVIVFTSKDNPPSYEQLARAVEESGFTLVNKSSGGEMTEGEAKP